MKNLIIVTLAAIVTGLALFSGGSASANQPNGISIHQGASATIAPIDLAIGDTRIVEFDGLDGAGFPVALDPAGAIYVSVGYGGDLATVTPINGKSVSIHATAGFNVGTWLGSLTFIQPTGFIQSQMQIAVHSHDFNGGVQARPLPATH